MTKIKQAREDMSIADKGYDYREREFKITKWFDKNHDLIKRALTALEKLEAIDGKALGEALEGAHENGYNSLTQEGARAMYKAARAVAEIKGE